MSCLSFFPVAKQTENNNLTNLTININSQHIQHDEVGNTRSYTEQNNLIAIECHTIQLPQFRDCMTYSTFRCTIF